MLSEPLKAALEEEETLFLATPLAKDLDFLYFRIRERFRLLIWIGKYRNH